MELALRVCYRIEMLPIICSFVTETACAFGATAKEVSELRLAAEETVVSILEHFPADDAAAFEVTCRTRAAGVEYVFHNLGLPMNVAALPRYDAAAPDQSIDSPAGLRLFLARKMVDELAFVNRGHDG